jgi:hypothetical protein
MGFKLYSDGQVDRPVLVCDVCGETNLDLWNDKATGTPTFNGQLSTVTVHHRTCVPPTGSVTMLLIDFLRLFSVQSRLGDLATNGLIDSVAVEYPTGRRFQV